LTYIDGLWGFIYAIRFMADLWLTATIQHPPSTTPSKTQNKKKKTQKKNT
jgi:hypothetical protein